MDIDMGDYDHEKSAKENNEPTPEQEEEMSQEAIRKEAKSEGMYYLGILQGLLLGIGGNLLVAYSIEVLKGVIPQDAWFLTNLIGLIVGLIIVYVVSRSLYLKAKKLMK
jgi:hypothetical protein